jgi:acyl dehydratase
VTSQVEYRSVETGHRLPEKEFRIPLVNEIMYCGAGLDFVGVHWNERVAQSVGMPHVVAHGPLTEAKAITLVNEWTGDPGAVVEQRARFLKPVLIPDDGVGAVYRVSGEVTEKLPGNRVVVGLVAVSPEGEELATVRAVVQLA